MTAEEKAFNDALDANPDDHTTHLVYADWLDEHGEPERAAGHRAMGLLRKTPWWFKISKNYGWLSDDDQPRDVGEKHLLPADWLVAIPTSRHVSHSADYYSIVHLPAEDDRVKPHVLFKATAIGFSRLPPERQAELLTPAVPAASG